MKKIFLLAFLVYALNTAYAQRSLYSIIEGGAQLGFSNEGYEGAFNGYAFHFIFGQNFSDRAYLGLGFGNETFTGKYKTNNPHDGDQTRREYDTYMLPIFVDARLPIGYFGEHSRIGLMGNAGYAPKIGPVYDKGFLFRAGFFYLYETGRRTNYTASFNYGYQQLSKNLHALGKDFQHQHFSVSIGVMFK